MSRVGEEVDGHGQRLRCPVHSRLPRGGQRKQAWRAHPSNFCSEGRTGRFSSGAFSPPGNLQPIQNKAPNLGSWLPVAAQPDHPHKLGHNSLGVNAIQLTHNVTVFWACPGTPPGFPFDLKTCNPEKHPSGWFLWTLRKGNTRQKGI